MSARRILLSVLLWTEGSGGAPAPVSGNTPSPAVGLVFDLVTASGGAPQPVAGGLSASFFNIQSALLTARRIQWVLEGITGSSQPLTSAALVYSVEDSAHVDPGALQQAAPGQLLLSQSVADAIQQLPTAQIRDAAFAGWRQLQWKTTGLASGFATDEEVLLRLIREQGREDPCAPQPEIPKGVPSSTAIPAWAAPLTGSHTATHALTDHSPQPAIPPKWWIIGGGAAAALVIAVVIALTIPGHKPPLQQQPPPADTTSKSAGSGSQGTSAGGEKPADTGKSYGKQSGTSASHSGKQSRTDSKPDHDTDLKQKPSAGSCEFTDAEIPRSLDRATSDMHNGRLTDAQALFQRLLGCPSAHEKAQEGLQLVKQRIETQR